MLVCPPPLPVSLPPIPLPSLPAKTKVAYSNSATQKQLDYIKGLGGKASASLTKETASEMISRLLADPATRERQQKKREQEERQREKHESYYLKKEVEDAKAVLEESVDDEDREAAKEDIRDAELNRLQFWQLTFSMDAFESEEATKLFEKQGKNFHKPNDAQIQQVLNDLDSKSTKWEIKSALSFYDRLAELYPSLKKR
jgi:hypothetical protein